MYILLKENCRNFTLGVPFKTYAPWRIRHINCRRNRTCFTLRVLLNQ